MFCCAILPVSETRLPIYAGSRVVVNLFSYCVPLVEQDV